MKRQKSKFIFDASMLYIALHLMCALIYRTIKIFFDLKEVQAMNVEVWLKIALVIGGCILASIPECILLFRALKAKRVAKTEAEREAAKNDLMEVASTLIAKAEVLYAGVDEALKAKGDSAGSVKKDSVLSKLQAYAISKSYLFDMDFWSEKIDEIVALTKNVNAKR